MKTSIIKISAVAIVIVFFSLQCKKDNESDADTSSLWDTAWSDNFQRADGPLGDHYSVQVTYGTGTTKIENNRIRFEGSGYWAIRDSVGIPGDVIRVSVNCIVEKGKPSFGIALKSQNLGSNWRHQEFYAVFVDSTSIGIFKHVSTPLSPSDYPVTLISKSINIQSGHTYKLQFVDINKNLATYIEDLNSAAKDSVKYTDSGASLTGTIVSLNGNNRGTSDLLFFDDFVIEKGK